MADPATSDTGGIDVNALMSQSSSDFAPFKTSPEELQSLKSGEQSALQADTALASKEVDVLNQPGPGPQPQRDTGILKHLAPLLLFSAFGGKATKLNASAMLGASTGMVRGMLTANDQQYKEATEQYDKAYKEFKDRQATQVAVYEKMREAYKGTADADQKAIQMALSVTGDEWKVKSNIVEMWNRQRQQGIELQKLNDSMRHQEVLEQISLKKLELEQQKYQPSLTDDTAKLVAQRLINGEKPSVVMGNMGRGTQGAANIALIQNYLTSMTQGQDPKKLALAQQQLVSYQRALTVIGQREGSLAIGLGEVTKFGPIAIQASANVPRGNWKGLTKTLQYGAEQASDPQLAKLQVATASLISAYATVIGRGNQSATVTAQNRASELLSNADGPEAYKVRVQQITMEAQMAAKVPQEELQKVEAQEFPGVGGATPDSQSPAARTVVRTGTLNGRKVVQYSDGTTEYAD